GDGMFHLFPISVNARVIALLYADGESVQVDCLDLLACVAGSIVEARSSAAAKPSNLVNIAAAGREHNGDEWSELSEADRELHRRAQRFSRVQVASLRLYES